MPKKILFDFCSFAYDFLFGPISFCALCIQPRCYGSIIFDGYCEPEYRYKLEDRLLIVFSVATGYYCWTELGCYDGNAF